MGSFFLLLPNVRITKGAKRSVIQNFQLSVFHFIPNSMYDFIISAKGLNKEEIYQLYSDDEKVVTEYIAWLKKMNFIIFIDLYEELNQFDSISDDWDMPYLLTNCILEINNTTSLILKESLIQIDELKVPHLEVRINSVILQDQLIELINLIQHTNVNTLKIFLPFFEGLDIKQLKVKLKYYTILREIIFFNTPVKKRSKYLFQQGTAAIYLISSEINNSCCGNIDFDKFHTNIQFYNESKKFNSCLNRKLSIDYKGNIKNCPSFKKSFGNILEKPLREVLSNSAFIQTWQINKDQIAVCKDCEFRFMCTDCRAYLQNPNDIFSKPIKCGYNPYNCTWEKWDTITSNSAGIMHYKF